MALFVPRSEHPAYDVIICGGGLAGATLSRQLKLHHPDISILMLDRQTYPVPPAAHKVGESTVEIAGFYFADALRLEAYMDRVHLPKLGLRYFWQSDARRFADRPEVGLSAYTRCKSYQIDRGLLENDLFQMNCDAGVEILQDVRVADIRLGGEGGWHEVSWLDGNEREHRAWGRWVIDAMGRRRFLQSKLGLKKEVEEKFNAVWFRVKGRLDIEDFVPDTETQWHERVPGRKRYHSTNHLMGPGYWIWLIPLGSGNTSVGIVTSAVMHDFMTMDSLEKALTWLQTNDAAVHEALAGREFMDFLGFRDFNYSTRQMFSRERWACIGEAAAFSDPFYSPGSNMIGFENTAVVWMIGEDHSGTLSDERIKFLDEFMISQNDWLDYNIHTSYPYFGNPLVMSLSFLWDTAVGWGIATPQMFNSIFLDKDTTRDIRAKVSHLYALALQVKKLFIAWGKRSRHSAAFDFIDYYRIPFLQEIYDRCLHKGKSRQEIIDDYGFVMQRLEEFAQVIFVMAVQDTMPAQLERLGEPLWLNAWAMSLEPERWEEDGLFRPAGLRRSVASILSQIRSLYRPAHVQPGCPAGELTIELSL